MFSCGIIIIARKSNFVKRKRKNNIKGDDILKIDKKKTIEELAREERLAYFREWRANNKDKVKKHNTTYWQNRAKRRLAEREANQNEEE